MLQVTKHSSPTDIHNKGDLSASITGSPSVVGALGLMDQPLKRAIKYIVSSLTFSACTVSASSYVWLSFPTLHDPMVTGICQQVMMPHAASFFFDRKERVSDSAFQSTISRLTLTCWLKLRTFKRMNVCVPPKSLWWNLTPTVMVPAD